MLARVMVSACMMVLPIELCYDVSLFYGVIPCLIWCWLLTPIMMLAHVMVSARMMALTGNLYCGFNPYQNVGC